MTEYVALFGDPVAGNPTSRMQNAAFAKAGLDWHYLDIRVVAADLGEAVRSVRALGFGGLNLTVPHKVAVLPLLDELEASAEICGAVNTVRREGDGRLVGLNTDGLGFLESLREAGVDVEGIDVVVLGAGGAARAVSVELALAGAGRIMVAGRSADRRDALVQRLRERTQADATALDWNGIVKVPACDVLVDCTPIGMGTGAAAMEVVPADLAALPPGAIVCDLNPDRADTAFLERARERGHRTLGGLPMLARQGAAGFTAWTGVAAPLDTMVAALGAPKNDPTTHREAR
jgi:shikimate dehydrogenase